MGALKWGLLIEVSQKGSRERCLPVFSENETDKNEENGRKRKENGKKTERNGRKRKKTEENGQKTREKRKKTEENGRKRKKTEENGRKRKKSEATPFRRPLLRNPDLRPQSSAMAGNYPKPQFESSHVGFPDRGPGDEQF